MRGAANSHSSLSYLEVNTKSTRVAGFTLVLVLTTPKHPHKRGGRVGYSMSDDRSRPTRVECVSPGDPDLKPDSLNTYRAYTTCLLEDRSHSADLVSALRFIT